MTPSSPRAGYTLPVFAAAAAVAALRQLYQDNSVASVSLELFDPPETAEIDIEQVARLNENMALAIARSDPGDNLDLTRNTPVWAWVERRENHKGDRIVLRGGEGIGRHQHNDKPAIYGYARRLLLEHLTQWLPPNEAIAVTIILPQGRQLARRTSNEAFGIVEGLSLLGTTGIAQPLSAPGQLDECQAQLQQKAEQFDCLVFCIGENGLDLARQMGIDSGRLVKTANWIGSLLVAAGAQNVKSIVLFGYHGKAIKLAGGIFHTHHHLADGRLEILTAHCANLGLPTPALQAIFASSTTEDALKQLRAIDRQESSQWVNRVYAAIAREIDRRCGEYIRKHGDATVEVGSVLFDRQRRIIVRSEIGSALLRQIC